MHAVEWAISYFNVYLWGRRFILHTDHKQLKTLKIVIKKTGWWLLIQPSKSPSPSSLANRYFSNILLSEQRFQTGWLLLTSVRLPFLGTGMTRAHFHLAGKPVRIMLLNTLASFKGIPSWPELLLASTLATCSLSVWSSGHIKMQRFCEIQIQIQMENWISKKRPRDDKSSHIIGWQYVRYNNGIVTSRSSPKCSKMFDWEIREWLQTFQRLRQYIFTKYFKG